MPNCFFVSDLHGSTTRYNKLIEAMVQRRPEAVFIGGDLLPHGLARRSKADPGYHDFVGDFLVNEFSAARNRLKEAYPRVFIILGNDDPRSEEESFEKAAQSGLWEYIHTKKTSLGGHDVYGYAFVPPTPFMFKDWDRYDVSRYVDPGCISPEEGIRTVEVSKNELRHATIKKDLQQMTEGADLTGAIFLFHTPPYKTNLDRAALDGKTVDHAPVDVHVGSIAVREFIESRGPLVTLHGHVHESTRMTGRWQDRIGQTYAFSAAHDGPELALVSFDPDNLSGAARELL